MWERERAVEDGAAWLDEHEPGWTHYINIGTLDLGHCDQCILGQLQRRKYRHINGYFGFLRDRQLTDHWSALHGFQLPPLLAFWRSTDSELSALRDAWIASIRKRLMKDMQ